MHVNEAWGHHPTISLNDPASLRLVKLADSSNSLATNANISVVPFSASYLRFTNSYSNEFLDQ